MKIGIDASTITPDKAGIGYFTYSLLKEVLKADTANSYTLFTNKQSLLSEFSHDLPAHATIAEIPEAKAGFTWIRKVVRVLKKENYDLFFSPTNFTFGILFPKTIQMVHDLAPLKYPQFYSGKGAFMYRILLRFMVRRVYKIGVLCKTIREELIDYNISTQNKTFVTSVGLHEWTLTKPSQSEQARVKEKYNLPDNFLLSLSTLEPRKNHARMIRAFAEIANEYPDLHYVIGGKKGWFYDEVFETVERLGLNERIHFLGYVAEQDIPHLFDQARFFAYCSLYEGFGIPCIEAYSRGVPVLTSDVPILRETMEDKGVYADPLDYRDIAHKYREMYQAKKFKPSEDFLNKYSWAIAARNLISEYS